MNRAYLCLGGNLGDRERNLESALELLNKHAGKVRSASSVYETASWGNTGQPNYLNQAIEIETQLPAPDLLQKCLFVEHELGRTRNVKWENRPIDIDILFFNNEIIDLPELKVPHPLLHERLFVLYPLNDIAPDLVHPVIGKKINELLKTCPDRLKVERI